LPVTPYAFPALPVISVIIQFMIIAFCIFIVIKGLNSLKKKDEVVEDVVPALTKEEVLLTEIRDILQKK